MYKDMYAVFGLQPGAVANDVETAFLALTKNVDTATFGHLTADRDLIESGSPEVDQEVYQYYVAECSNPGTAVLVALIKWALAHYIEFHSKRITFSEWNVLLLIAVFGLAGPPRTALSKQIDLAMIMAGCVYRMNQKQQK